MKTKIVVLVGIALCTMLLISPALASSVDTLEIYGNAYEDDTIDMRDLTYVKLIFFGKKPETELADAKYDGKINPLDFIQIKLIIVGKEKEITFVDTADRIVTVKKPIKRIVSSNTNAIETMRSLKLEKDRIAGVPERVHKFSIFFPEFSDHPYVGGYPLDIEKILSLNPDAVFLYGTFGKPQENIKKLEDMGIIVLGFDYFRPANIYVEETKKLGYIIDKEKEAEEFLEFYEGCVNTIKEKVEEIPEDERPRVYFESSRPYHTAGKGVGYHQKLEMAGGNNIFGDLSGYPDVDPEEVINRNPEIIVRSAWKEGGYAIDDITELSDIREEIMDRLELAKVTAVKNERVYILSNDILGEARHFVSIAYMAKWFHPELFEDLDPKAIHQEYLTRFQELDYDLKEHGTFVYPEPS